MKLFFNIDVHPFYKEIKFNITDGEETLELLEHYENAQDDWGSFIFKNKQYDWNINHTYGNSAQELVSIYNVNMETFNTEYDKPLKNKWVRIFI